LRYGVHPAALAFRGVVKAERRVLDPARVATGGRGLLLAPRRMLFFQLRLLRLGPIWPLDARKRRL